MQPIEFILEASAKIPYALFDLRPIPDGKQVLSGDTALERIPLSASFKVEPVESITPPKSDQTSAIATRSNSSSWGVAAFTKRPDCISRQLNQTAKISCHRRQTSPRH